ncbi:MAG: class I SAM-dependent methyltransferase [Chloroflexota bacterium]
MTKPMNFAFDERVQEKYNHQRQHPTEVARRIGEQIAQQLPDALPVLEIGVGTGRIAWQVANTGRDVVGFDLSPHMLAEIEATRPTENSDTGALLLSRADMHHIPYADNSFGTVMVTHVLHLATDWQQVLRETARVLTSDGVLIQGSDWVDPNSVFGALRNEVRMEAVRQNPNMMPPSAGISKDDYLAKLGGTDMTEIIAAEWETTLSVNERLSQYKQRLDNESWIFSEEMFAKIYAHLETFAGEKWADHDAPLPLKRRFMLKLTRGNWSDSA